MIAKVSYFKLLKFYFDLFQFQISKAGLNLITRLPNFYEWLEILQNKFKRLVEPFISDWRA